MPPCHPESFCPVLSKLRLNIGTKLVGEGTSGMPVKGAQEWSLNMPENQRLSQMMLGHFFQNVFDPPPVWSQNSLFQGFWGICVG